MSRTTSRDGILKVGPQYYRVFIELEPGADGARHRESHTVRGSLEQAKAKKATLLADKSRGQYVGRSDQRLSDYLESWLVWKQAQVADRTWERYCSLIRSSIVPALGTKRLQDLATQHLDDYYANSLATETGHKRGSKLSATTVHHRHVVLKMALKRAVELGLITRNPAEFTSPPRVARPQLKVLDAADAELLIASTVGSPAELPTYLALTTGARLGELLALRWQDIDFAAGVVLISRTLVEHLIKPETGSWYGFKEPKNGHSRSVDVGASTIERLKAYRKAQAQQRLSLGIAWTDLDLVFTTIAGEPIRPSAVSTAFRAAAKRAGLEGARFHDCRHAHATILLKGGTQPHVVSKRLGHSTVGFTLQVYAHVLPGQQRDAADAIEAALVSGARG
jgi:integrase